MSDENANKPGEGIVVAVAESITDAQRLAALRRLRELSGYSTRRAASRLGVTPNALRSWESGSVTPSASQLRAVIRLYGHDVLNMLAERQPLTSQGNPGILIVGSSRVDTSSIRRLHSDSTAANRLIVDDYLAAVRHERGLGPTDRVELRSIDLTQLSTELDISDNSLQSLLTEALNLTPAGSQRVTRAVLVASLMAVTALNAFNSGWLADTSVATSHQPRLRSVFAVTAAPAEVMSGSSDAKAVEVADRTAQTPVRGPLFTIHSREAL